MTRKRRVWFPNAIYHITNRGNRKEDIFLDDYDRQTYLNMIEDVRIRYPFQLHSYCLMSNHIHLQLQTLEDPIYNIMKLLNTKYAKHFNRRHNLVGHVFQGRYGSELIHSIDYELNVSKYIHLNPVEAYMVKKPELYPWSSYKAYVYNERNPHVNTERILSYFPPPQALNYLNFITQDDVLPNPPDHLIPYIRKSSN